MAFMIAPTTSKVLAAIANAAAVLCDHMCYKNPTEKELESAHMYIWFN
jgi:hypothetical protein